MQTRKNKQQWKTVAIYVDLDSAEILTKEKFNLNYKKLETLKRGGSKRQERFSIHWVTMR